MTKCVLKHSNKKFELFELNIITVFQFDRHNICLTDNMKFERKFSIWPFSFSLLALIMSHLGLGVSVRVLIFEGDFAAKCLVSKMLS